MVIEMTARKKLHMKEASRIGITQRALITLLREAASRLGRTFEHWLELTSRYAEYALEY